MSLHPDVANAFEQIDAAVYSGDSFFDIKNRVLFRAYINRWKHWDETNPYYAADGTLMNPDGTRSIFDDVDK